MRRIIAGAAVVIVLLGWAAWAHPWAPAVPLLTGVSAEGCFAGGEPGQTGSLLPDAQFGTSFKGQPVMWPDGFSARRAGDQVAVLNSSGQVVATTGRLYHISRAPLANGELGVDRPSGHTRQRLNAHIRTTSWTAARLGTRQLQVTRANSGAHLTPRPSATSARRCHPTRNLLAIPSGP